jgi:hypothetical protein
VCANVDACAGEVLWCIVLFVVACWSSSSSEDGANDDEEDFDSEVAALVNTMGLSVLSGCVLSFFLSFFCLHVCFVCFLIG